jgi:hypothetical protein
MYFLAQFKHDHSGTRVLAKRDSLPAGNFHIFQHCIQYTTADRRFLFFPCLLQSGYHIRRQKVAGTLKQPSYGARYVIGPYFPHRT